LKKGTARRKEGKTELCFCAQKKKRTRNCHGEKKRRRKKKEDLRKGGPSLSSPGRVGKDALYRGSTKKKALKGRSRKQGKLNTLQTSTKGSPGKKRDVPCPLEKRSHAGVTVRPSLEQKNIKKKIEKKAHKAEWMKPPSRG